MAYLKPPAVTRKLFNPLAMRLGIGGSATLAVARRSSGTTQQVPVIPIDHGGARYVVSTRGESQWVKNVRSAGTVELRERGRSQRFTAVEIAVAERSPVLDAYRATAGRMVETYWKRLPDAADHPTFRLDPTGGV
jgi:hypothetical protein